MKSAQAPLFISSVVSWLPGLAYDAMEQHYRLGPRCGACAFYRPCVRGYAPQHLSVLTWTVCSTQYAVEHGPSTHSTACTATKPIVPLLAVKTFWLRPRVNTSYHCRLTIVVGLMLHSAGHCGLWMVATRRLQLQYWQVRAPRYAVSRPLAASNNAGSGPGPGRRCAEEAWRVTDLSWAILQHVCNVTEGLPPHRWWVSPSLASRAAAGWTPPAWRPTSATSLGSAASSLVRACSPLLPGRTKWTLSRKRCQCAVGPVVCNLPSLHLMRIECCAAGILKSLMGLSGSVFTTVYIGAFKPHGPLAPLPCPCS